MVILVVKGLECIFPVFESHVGLLVRIDFSEELLVQGNSQVEASEDVRFLNEFDEALEGHSVGVFGGLVKAVFESRILVRDNETDLLNGGELPVMGTGLSKAASHGRGELLVCFAGC